MDPITATIVVGAGLQAFGSWSSSRSQAKAARAQAKLREAQARELMERARIQEKRLFAQGEEFKAQQTVGYASSGAALGTGATLVALEDTNSKIAQQVDDMKRETMFKVNQLLMGASVDMQSASDMETAGAISGFGSLLSGAVAFKKST